MAIPQLRVRATDNKIDWGASDYVGSGSNAATGSYTYGQAGVDGGPSGTDDDYPPSGGPSSHDVTAAGAHPHLNIFIRYCDAQSVEHTSQAQPKPCADPVSQNLARIRSLKLRLPPGLIGNPQAVPPCPWAILVLGVAETVCNDSAVGVVRSWTLTAGSPTGSVGVEQPTRDVLLYNTETIGDEPARLASDLRADGRVPPLPIVLAARQRDGDVGIESFTNNLPATWGAGQYLKILEQNITLFPRAPIYRPDNHPPGGNIYDDVIQPKLEGGVDVSKPFLTNPTSCGQKTVELEANSWEEGPPPGDPNDPSSPGAISHATASDSFEVTGCDSGDPDRPSFDRPADPAPGGLPADSASVTAGPDLSRGGTDQAGAPSAYTVKVHVPDTEASDVHGTHLKDATVTLPKGVTLAPGAGDGLEGCSASEFDLGHPDDAVSCPAGSRIADVSVDTPLLPNPLSGSAYFGTPAAGPATDANPWKLYLLIEGSGNRVKLAGDITIDPDTGQITNKFTHSPQLPFTDLELRLNGGDKSVLQNPTDCGPHLGAAQLVGWSGEVKDLVPSVTVSNCNDDPPFGPSVSAHADDESAGASSPSHLGVDRPDGDARLTKLALALPQGLVGSLTTVPLCPAADITQGTCPDNTKIGGLKTTIGYGSATLEVPGSLYIGKGTEPGDAAALSAVIPSKIGPIDFGNVVVVNHIKLRPDGGLTATTDDVHKVPTIIGGIPIYVKQIKIDVDRPGFLTNPTGCDPRTLVGDFDSDSSKHANASVQLTATNCGKLPFGPKLAMTATGEHGRFQHPGLKAVVTQTPGQAAIKRAVVVLPETLRPELPTIQKSLCTTPQLNANACPPAAIIGNATASTPLLPEPLTGPVFLIQDPNINDPLPKIVVRLAGMVSIDLSARNTIQGIKTVNTFNEIPDVPVTSFELDIKGGKPGILKNFYELCDRPSKADATFTGQNGKVHVTKPPLQLPSCEPNIGTSTATMSKKGVVSLKIRCGSKGCATGKVSIQTSGASVARTVGAKNITLGANQTETVRIKLSRSARRTVLKHKKLSAKAVLSIGTTKVTRTLKIKAPKKKRH